MGQEVDPTNNGELGEASEAVLPALVHVDIQDNRIGLHSVAEFIKGVRPFGQELLVRDSV